VALAKEKKKIVQTGLLNLSNLKLFLLFLLYILAIPLTIHVISTLCARL
jgi:hypothetical protein